MAAEKVSERRGLRDERAIERTSGLGVVRDVRKASKLMRAVRHGQHGRRRLSPSQHSGLVQLGANTYNYTPQVAFKRVCITQTDVFVYEISEYSVRRPDDVHRAWRELLSSNESRTSESEGRAGTFAEWVSERVS